MYVSADNMSSEADKVSEEVIQSSTEDDEDIVNPWDVASSSAKGVDYSKLISKFNIDTRKSGEKTAWYVLFLKIVPYVFISQLLIRKVQREASE